MELDKIYSELILEHSKHSDHKRALEHFDYKERGHNPSCGDEIFLEVKLNGNLIEDAGFTGNGCAISQASASMMIELILGKSVEDAMKDVELFLAMIKKEVESDEELENLGDAMVLQNLSNMPARVKCGVLAWHSLKQILLKENH